MKIEIKYSQGSSEQHSLRHLLEDLIAEERLPIAVELTELSEPENSHVKIHLADNKSSKEIPMDRKAIGQSKLFERLKSELLADWQDYSTTQLNHLI